MAVTPERPAEGEAARIEELLTGNGADSAGAAGGGFVAGRFDRVHVRHPGATMEELEALVGAVAPELRGRLTLHDHLAEAARLGVGGVHLNRREPTAPPGWTGRVSRSCHTVDEALEARGYDYVTLSPVFDSLSKPGYRAAFTPADLRRLDAAQVPVIALGGVTPANVGELEPYNFAGYAMLTAAFPPNYENNQAKTPK